MSIKLIALDLDGTLLDSQKELPELNKKALSECIRRGIHIVPCTGRIARGIPRAVLEIPGIRYAITVNGGVLVDMQENRILDQTLLEPGIVLEVFDVAKQYHVMYDAYIGGKGYSTRRFYENLDQFHLPKVIQTMVHNTREPVEDIYEYVKERNTMVDKVNLFFADMAEREEVRQQLNARGDVLVSSSYTFNLEINALGATKGDGILRLASILGIRTEETMAFGDGENDFSMVSKAGISVAMDNGDERLKKMADYVAPCNDEAGVGQMIERLVLA